MRTRLAQHHGVLEAELGQVAAYLGTHRCADVLARINFRGSPGNQFADAHALSGAIGAVRAARYSMLACPPPAISCLPPAPRRTQRGPPPPCTRWR
jgi:hypothetical protein